MNEIKIRVTSPKDYPTTEAVMREAFWNVYKPGATEHYVLHLMRQWSSFLTEFDLIAVEGERIVGNVVCNQTYIAGDDRRYYRTIGVGPIGVLPEYQRRGIGAALLDRLRLIAATMNTRALILYGDPNYYLSKGFRAASDFKVRTEENYYAASLMMFAFNSIVAGRYLENVSYRIDEAEFRLFDARFPIKEKIAGTSTQLRYKEVLAMRRRYRGS